MELTVSDRQTDGRTDKVSYRGACYAPKKLKEKLQHYFFLHRRFHLRSSMNDDRPCYINESFLPYCPLSYLKIIYFMYISAHLSI